MAATWRKAPEYVLDMARRLIDTKSYLEPLQEARIAIIMRSEAGSSSGKAILGRAAKVSDQDRLYMDFDFKIWLAEDYWGRFDAHQREALLTHELLHCSFVGESAKIRPHDVEEFEIVIREYGFWWPGAHSFASAVQAAFPLPEAESDEPRGSVGTIDFGELVEAVEAQMQAEGFDVEVDYVPAGARGE